MTGVTDEPSVPSGRSVAYLRDVQYRDSSKLTARANLHSRYGTASTPWFAWVVQQIEWRRDAVVLEVGCGPGWIWEQARHGVPGDLHLMLTDLSIGMVSEAVERTRASFGDVDGAVAEFVLTVQSWLCGSESGRLRGPIRCRPGCGTAVAVQQW